MGAQISRKGVSFQPSVGMSSTVRWGTEIYASKAPVSDSREAETFPFLDELEFNEWIDNNINRKDFGVEETSAFNSLDLKLNGNKYWRGNDGFLYKIDLKTYKYEEIGGLTLVKYNGFSRTSDISVSRRYACDELTAVLNHELIHAYHFSLGYNIF